MMWTILEVGWDPRTWAWSDPDQITAIVGILTVGALGVAAIIAARQLSAATRAQRQSMRPYVSLDLVPAHGIVFRFELQNFGKTAATDVAIEFAPPFVSTWDGALETPAFVSVVPFLVPGRKHRWIADHAPDRKKSSLPDKFVATIAYSGPDGVRYNEDFEIDFGLYWGMQDIRDKGMHDLVNEVEKIRKSIDDTKRRVPWESLANRREGQT
jgi:hypothetical protein